LGETPISPIRLNPNLPVQFESILNKALEKDASLRYQHASELLVDLQRLKRDLSSELIPANTRRLPPFWPTARFMQPFVGLLGVCILGFYILRPTPEPHITATRQVTHEGRIVGWSAADGNRLYFSTPVSSYGLQLRETSVKGGDSVEMRSPIRNPMLFDISSDRSVLLVGDASILTSNSQPLWILPILGGSPRRVGNAMAQSASFSPDGEQIVYAKLVELHITRKDGTEIRTLPVPTNHPSSIKWVRWSPDGRLIRFDVVIDNHDETWEVQPDGAALRRFLPEWKSSLDISGGIWTPDAKYFLFLGNQNGISNAYAMRELNHTWPYFRRGPTQLTNGPFRIDWLSTSVDGKRIFVGGAVERRYLARLRAGGAQDSYLGGIDATWAEFSKDGKHVAYASSDFSNLWRCESDGSNRLQLTYDPFRAWLPRWSPDDKMLAFIGVDNSQISRIYVMPSEGGTAKPITHGESEDHNDMDPSWTPDGKSIVFSSDGMDTNNVRLRGVDLANGRVSALPGSYNLWSPRVSPDGSTIAALSGIDQALVLYDIRSHTQSILSSPGVGWPVWSRDGKWIYFNDGKAEQIRRIRLRDRRIETVADPKQAQILITGWIGLTPEGELLATRESKVEDIYALDWNAP